MKRPVVIVTRRLPESIETRMKELFDARLSPDDHAMTSQELCDAASAADVLVPTITEMLDAKVIAAAGPQLKLIANFGSGTDHIDVAGAQAKGSPSPTRRTFSPRTPPR